MLQGLLYRRVAFALRQPDRNGSVEHHVGAVGADELDHRDVQILDRGPLAVQDGEETISPAPKSPFRILFL